MLIPREYATIDWSFTECGCMGARRGQPLCPCAMEMAVIENGRLIVKVDMGPVPVELLKALNGAMSNEIRRKPDKGID